MNRSVHMQNLLEQTCLSEYPGFVILGKSRNKSSFHQRMVWYWNLSLRKTRVDIAHGWSWAMTSRFRFMGFISGRESVTCPLSVSYRICVSIISLLWSSLTLLLPACMMHALFLNSDIHVRGIPMQNEITCHRPKAKRLPRLGPNLSEVLKSKRKTVLRAFVVIMYTTIFEFILIFLYLF